MKALRFLGPNALVVVLFLACAGSWGQEVRKLVKKVDPGYPEIARKMHLQGAVRVEVTIAADGAVKSVTTLGGNPILAQSVEDAVKQWKYERGRGETRTLEFKF